MAGAPTRLLRGLPAARLLAVAQLVLLARQHIARLEPFERRRAMQLIGKAARRPREFTAKDRRELAGLVQKAEPRAFATAAAQRFTGVPLRRRGRR